MATPLPRVICSLLAAALVAVFLPTPSVANASGGTECPCWPAGTPDTDPLVCYASAGPSTNSFAYFSPPPAFLQTTAIWCRANGKFTWTSSAESQACERTLECACGDPVEICGNGVDDDCNPATADYPDGTCDLGACGVGHLACADGVTICNPTVSTFYEDDDVTCSDGLDNDCDDLMDCEDRDCGDYYPNGCEGPLVPIPEPGAIALFGLGLAAVMRSQRRRARR